MAVVQLSDVVIPEYFAQYMAENSPVSLSLLQSGVMVGNPLMQAQLSQGGDLLNIPMWTDLLSPGDPDARVNDFLNCLAHLIQVRR